MSPSRNLLIAIVFVQLALPATAQTTDALKSELSSIDQQILQAEQIVAHHEHGAIRRLAEMRRQALLLSRAVLESRILAAQGGDPPEVVIPAAKPDAAKANQILGEIADAQRRIDEAHHDAESSGGLIKAVALTRVEAEKLALAQLQMAYFQAKYGGRVSESVRYTSCSSFSGPKNVSRTDWRRLIGNRSANLGRSSFFRYRLFVFAFRAGTQGGRPE